MLGMQHSASCNEGYDQGTGAFVGHEPLHVAGQAAAAPLHPPQYAPGLLLTALLQPDLEQHLWDPDVNPAKSSWHGVSHTNPKDALHGWAVHFASFAKTPAGGAVVVVVVDGLLAMQRLSLASSVPESQFAKVEEEQTFVFPDHVNSLATTLPLHPIQYV